MRSLVVIPFLALALSSCAPPERQACGHLTDCPGALVCSAGGTCVENEAPEVVGSGITSVRSHPSDPLDELDITGGFAGSIGGTPFETTTPLVEGGSDGYVAYQLTTTALDGVSAVGMWFDIPLPSLLTEGEPRTFTLEEMMADGSFPCISLWNGEGIAAWAEDYTITVQPVDELGNVLLQIDATNSDSEAVATITVPALL